MIDGSKIKALRLARVLSLRQLGMLIGRSAMFLSLLERNKSGASTETIERLSAALGVVPAILIEKNNE